MEKITVFEVTGLNDTKARLKWVFPASCVAAKITRYDSEGKATVVPTRDEIDTIDDTGLVEGQTYTYEVVAEYKGFVKSEKLVKQYLHEHYIQQFAINVEHVTDNTYSVSWNMPANGINMCVYVDGQPTTKAMSEETPVNIELPAGRSVVNVGALSRGEWVISESKNISTYLPVTVDVIATQEDIHEERLQTGNGYDITIPITLSGELHKDVAGFYYAVYTEERYVLANEIENLTSKHEITIEQYKEKGVLTYFSRIYDNRDFYVTVFAYYLNGRKREISEPTYAHVKRPLVVEAYWGVKKPFIGAPLLTLRVDQNFAASQQPRLYLCTATGNISSYRDGEVLLEIESDDITRLKPSYTREYAVPNFDKNSDLYLFAEQDDLRKYPMVTYTPMWDEGFYGKLITAFGRRPQVTSQRAVAQNNSLFSCPICFNKYEKATVKYFCIDCERETIPSIQERKELKQTIKCNPEVELQANLVNSFNDAADEPDLAGYSGAKPDSSPVPDFDAFNINLDSDSDSSGPNLDSYMSSLRSEAIDSNAAVSDFLSSTKPRSKGGSGKAAPAKPVKGNVICNGIASVRRCPECTGIIPPTALQTTGNLPICIVGGPAAGKTNYITVMLEKLKAVPRLNLSLLWQNANTRRYQERNRDLIYKRHIAPDATDIEVFTPQIWELKLGTEGRTQRVDTYTFTIYDGAGEAQARMDENRATMDYVRNAEAIMLVVDPLQLKRVKDGGIIPQHIIGPSIRGGESEYDSTTVLEHLVTEIKGFRGIAADKKLDIPVAIILTKFDTVMNHSAFGEQALVKRRKLPVTNNKLNINEVEQVHNEIYSWLSLVEENFITVVNNHLSDYRLFGVSSYGSPPRDRGATPNNIAPRRVLDPILWLLHVQNFID